MRRSWPLVAVVVLVVAVWWDAGWTAGPSRGPTVLLGGQPYVELERVAAIMKTRVDVRANAVRAYLRPRGHTVVLTRNWARVLVDDKAFVLDAPVRVRHGVWIVPESFVEQVTRLIASRAPTAPDGEAPAAQTPAALPRTAKRGEATLQEIRYRSYPSSTRVVLETSEAVTYRIEPDDEREIRIRVTGLAGEARAIAIRDGFIEEVWLERIGTDALLRVMFDGAVGDLRPSTLVDPHRLVLDFVRPGAATEGARATTTPLRVMVLDAGHGGHDPGAQGPTGLMEKELVLDVTRRVAKLVARELGIKVLLSRDGDYFVPLRDRTTFANRAQADVFVSIHANAHREMASEGVETYFLSSEATDNAARQVAAAENSVIQLERPVATGGRADLLKTILWDLAQSEYLEHSSRLAEVVQDSMTRALRIPSRGVKQAGFYVLGGAAMPAILVEIGFVTNPREERKLRESHYRDDIARAIAAGLAAYKRDWDRRVRQTLGRSR